MSRKSPAFSFYPDSWVLGTMAMTFEEQGVYLRMLCFQWANGASDANAYANACGVAYETHVKRILDSKFISINGVWLNERLEAERDKQAARSNKASQSANKRWDTKKTDKPTATTEGEPCERNARGNANAYANAMLENMLSVSVSVSDSVSNTNKKSVSSEEYPEEFETFWKAFPPKRRTKKAAAFTAFRKAIKKGVSVEKITEAAREYANSDEAHGQYVQGPAPWLNEGRWDDEREAWKSKSAPVSKSKSQTLLENINNNMDAFING